MDLFYKADDGTYHKLSEITELEETIMDSDDKLFINPEEALTVKRLKENGCFEQELHFEIKSYAETKKLMDEINSIIDGLVKKHADHYELMWICELAKRYLKEHVGDGSSDLS